LYNIGINKKQIIIQNGGINYEKSNGKESTKHGFESSDGISKENN
jgi:hypothetical protein